MLDELFSELREVLLNRNPSLEHVTRRVRRYIAEVCENQEQWVEGATVFDLNLPGRVANILHSRGFVTVRAIIQTSAKELEAEKAIGPRVVEQLRRALRERRLALRGEVVSVFDLPKDGYPDPFEDDEEI